MQSARDRDPGLQLAISKAGGIGKLARSIGVSQPSVSTWCRVPPHRVIQVERLTGINRRILRPDLYDVPEPLSSQNMAIKRSAPG